MGRKAEILAWYPRLELLCLIIRLCLVTFKFYFHYGEGQCYRPGLGDEDQ
jgi:hypothetical protein